MVSASRLYMSMSLDGFVTGPNPSDDNALGDDGMRLHAWLFPDGDADFKDSRLEGVNRQVYDEFMSTGAVVAGRGTFEPAGGWEGDHHDGVQIFVLSRQEAPAWTADWPLVHYASDLSAAMAAARDAAGEKDVLVHGATVAQLALRDGLLDELEVHLVDVLLGQGRRLFEDVPVELERLRVLEGEGGVTHLRYRVRR